jgi:hypothetical protein
LPGSIPFIPGRLLDRPYPLARFLPPIPEGVVTAWLQDHVPAGTWVLDPFGSIPELPVEAARAGYRVLVAANNPVSRFLLEMASSPSTEESLRGALADIAAIRKGDQRLEPLIQSLYTTLCAKCGREVIADAFIWERDELVPYARIYSCPHCGDEGERPVKEEDITRAASFSSSGLHQAWALERVTPVNDPDRAHAREALNVYRPRSLYAMFNLITKLEGLSQPPERQRLTDALLVSACDRASNLWPYPATRSRPRQLITPTRHYEYNVWKSLEEAVKEWTQAGPAVPLTIWPELPAEDGGITLFEGRLTRLSAHLGDLRFGAVLATLPRPNQAFWTLSAIWSAWLWGHDSLGPFKSVLRRRRYDWSWHASALYATYERLGGMLEEKTPILGLSAEAEPGLISSAVVAGAYAGLELQGIALRPTSHQVQFSWVADSGKISARDKDLEAEEIAGKAGREFLAERGEPVPYICLHAAGLEGLADSGMPGIRAENPASALALTQDTLQQVSSYRQGFLRFGGSQHSLEVGLWWLVESEETQAPLADRVEVELVDLLQQRPGWLANELDTALCSSFRGLLTPESSLVRTCLESYGVPSDTRPVRWSLGENETQTRRDEDLADMHDLIFSLGKRLSFQIDGNSPICWRSQDDQIQYAFFIITSAEVGSLLLSAQAQPTQSIILLPGGRSNLVLYKLQHDPRLATAVEQGWRFLKYRHLRRLMDSEIINNENFDDQLDLDPLTFTEPQIPLF